MFYQDIWQPCFHLRKVVAEVSCAIKILGHNFQFKEERKRLPQREVEWQMLRSACR
jgi:hypothetical protein